MKAHIGLSAWCPVLKALNISIKAHISLSIWSPLIDDLKFEYRGTHMPIPLCPFTDGVKLKYRGTCRTIPMLFVYCRRKCVEAHIGLSTWCPFIDSIKFLCQVTKRKLQAVTFLTYIGEVDGWNLGWHTSYPHCVFFNPPYAGEFRWRLLPSLFVWIHPSL